jgi:hypothetical protein
MAWQITTDWSQSLIGDSTADLHYRWRKGRASRLSKGKRGRQDKALGPPRTTKLKECDQTVASLRRTEMDKTKQQHATGERVGRSVSISRPALPVVQADSAGLCPRHTDAKGIPAPALSPPPICHFRPGQDTRKSRLQPHRWFLPTSIETARADLDEDIERPMDAAGRCRCRRPVLACLAQGIPASVLLLAALRRRTKGVRLAGRRARHTWVDISRG